MTMLKFGTPDVCPICQGVTTTTMIKLADNTASEITKCHNCGFGASVQINTGGSNKDNLAGDSSSGSPKSPTKP